VLPLVVVNVLGAVAFAGLYGAAAGARLPAWLLPPLLAGAFVAVTLAWARVERRPRGLDPVRRLGRAALALVAVVVGLPVAVLLPVFWLEARLPLDAAGELHAGPIMALLLVALVLVVAANVAGGLVAVVAALGRRIRGRPAEPR